MDHGLDEADHEASRDTARAFVEREVVPHLARRDEERLIDRGTWLAAGRQGLIGLSGPERTAGRACPITAS